MNIFSLLSKSSLFAMAVIARLMPGWPVGGASTPKA